MSSGRKGGEEGRERERGKNGAKKFGAADRVARFYDEPASWTSGQQCTAYETAHTRTAKYTINQRESPVKPLMPRACATHQHATYDGSERDVAVALTSYPLPLEKTLIAAYKYTYFPFPPSPLSPPFSFLSLLLVVATRFDRRTGRTKYPRRVSNWYGLIKKFITLCFDSRGEGENFYEDSFIGLF